MSSSSLHPAETRKQARLSLTGFIVGMGLFLGTEALLVYLMFTAGL